MIKQNIAKRDLNSQLNNTPSKQVILFGAGLVCRRFLQHCPHDIDIIAIADNNAQKINSQGLFGNYHITEKIPHSKNLFGHKIISPNEIMNYEFDRIVITIDDDCTTKQNDKILGIYKQLLSLGVPDEKIILQNVNAYRTSHLIPRTMFLRCLSDEIRDLTGAVAECGVFRGVMASIINEYFPDKTLHLFDTFIGFDERDTVLEKGLAQEWLNNNFEDHSFGSVEITKLRLPYRSKAIIHKGYIPDILSELDKDERFVYVNLDMDLYAPTLSALRFFSSRMVNGGIITIHDYYCDDLPGIKEAVNKFAEEYKFSRVPVGDGYSIAIVIP